MAPPASATRSARDDDARDSGDDDAAAAAPRASLRPASAKAPEAFHWSYTDEPHASRRRAMLRDHPELKALQGYDWRSKYATAAFIGVQLYVATRVSEFSWPTVLLLAFVVGGTCTQALTLAIHEMCHNLMFRSPLANRLFSFVANTPLVFAYSVSFRKYHLLHHRWQGEAAVDTDVPTELEARVVGTSALRKTLWVFFQVLFYALRPLIVHPYSPGRWEALNWVVCVAFDAALVRYAGWRALAYLLLSMLLGLGPHPMAGHFLAEHYVFVDGAETYSYYGPLNFLGFWVGYHNEHHDMPRVPGPRLHRVREIAPEYYDDLPQYVSWARVIYDYVMSPHVSPYSRIKRKARKDKTRSD